MCLGDTVLVVRVVAEHHKQIGSKFEPLCFVIAKRVGRRSTNVTKKSSICVQEAYLGC